MCAVGMQIVFVLHDCSLNLRKMQDGAWESLGMGSKGHVVNCVSASLEVTLILSRFLVETLKM